VGWLGCSAGGCLGIFHTGSGIAGGINVAGAVKQVAARHHYGDGGYQGEVE
jgi:hypothetical protein